MIRGQIRRNLASRFQVWTTLKTNGEGSDPANLTRSYRGDETTVKATREKETDFAISVVEADVYGIFEDVPDPFVILRATKLMDIPIPRVVTNEGVQL